MRYVALSVAAWWSHGHVEASSLTVVGAVCDLVLCDCGFVGCNSDSRRGNSDTVVAHRTHRIVNALRGYIRCMVRVVPRIVGDRTLPLGFPLLFGSSNQFICVEAKCIRCGNCRATALGPV